MGRPQREAITNEAGAFRFTSIAAGKYVVHCWISVVDDEGLVVDTGTTQTHLSLAEGETVYAELKYGAQGTGRVYGAVAVDGEPVSHATLELAASTYSEGRWLRLQRRTRADAAGNYEFVGVPPGTYRLKSSDPSDRYRACRPGYLKVVDVVDGESIRVDVPGDAPTGTVIGTVRGADSPVHRVVLKAMESDLDTRLSAKPDGLGKFAYLGVSPGSYRLGCRAGTRYVEEIIRVSAERTTNQDLVFRTGAGSLVVRITKNGEPCPDLWPLVDIHKGGQIAVAYDRQESGVYRFDGLEPGEYTVQAVLQGSVKRVPARVDSGRETAVDLDFEGAAKLRGFLDTGEVWWTHIWVHDPGLAPAAEGEVLRGGMGEFLGVSAPPGVIASGAGGGTGSESYEITGIPAGEYTVTAAGYVPQSVPLQTKEVRYDVHLEGGEITELDISMVE